jgi:hypothetical protein
MPKAAAVKRSAAKTANRYDNDDNDYEAGVLVVDPGNIALDSDSDEEGALFMELEEDANNAYANANNDANDDDDDDEEGLVIDDEYETMEGSGGNFFSSQLKG